MGSLYSVRALLGGFRILILRPGSGLTPLGVIALLVLSSCNSAGNNDWRDRTIYAQVGHSIYELEPGRAYGLGGIDDEEVNAALAAGRGVISAPIIVQAIRIGVYSKDKNSLAYDAVVVAPGPSEKMKEAALSLGDASKIISVKLRQSIVQPSIGQPVERMEGDSIISIADRQPIALPTQCHGNINGTDFRITFCSTERLLLGRNLVSLRSLSPELDLVAYDFQQAIALMSRIERN